MTIVEGHHKLERMASNTKAARQHIRHDWSTYKSDQGKFALKAVLAINRGCLIWSSKLHRFLCDLFPLRFSLSLRACRPPSYNCWNTPATVQTVYRAGSMLKRWVNGVRVSNCGDGCVMCVIQQNYDLALPKSSRASGLSQVLRSISRTLLSKWWILVSFSNRAVSCNSNVRWNWSSMKGGSVVLLLVR